MINKVQLLKFAQNYETPLYIYNGNIIKKQYQKIEAAFSKCSNFQINYAIKALSNVAILKYVRKLGANVDAVSINEVKLALLAGFSAEKIFFTPNGVPFKEILEAINLEVNITLDNILQIEKIAQLYSDKYQNNKSIAVRINPKISDGGNDKVKVAHKNSKFGLPLEDIPKLHTLIATYGLRVEGLHIHLGSDISNIASFLASAKVLFKTAVQFDSLKFINFGGGFKVKYIEDDSFIDIDRVGVELTQAFNSFKKEYQSDLKLIVEPGKFLVSESGLFLVEITTIKKNHVFVNSGFNHFIRPMYYKAYHKISNISNTKASNKKYHVVGYICEQDIFGKDRNINTPNIGDILCFENAGAYSFTMASNYNSRLRPAELFYENEKISLIRKREDLEDLLSNQVY